MLTPAVSQHRLFLNLHKCPVVTDVEVEGQLLESHTDPNGVWKQGNSVDYRTLQGMAALVAVDHPYRAAKSVSGGIEVHNHPCVHDGSRSSSCGTFNSVGGSEKFEHVGHGELKSVEQRVRLSVAGSRPVLEHVCLSRERRHQIAPSGHGPRTWILDEHRLRSPLTSMRRLTQEAFDALRRRRDQSFIRIARE